LAQNASKRQGFLKICQFQEKLNEFRLTKYKKGGTLRVPPLLPLHPLKYHNEYGDN